MSPYAAGDRVRLIRTNDEHTRLVPGAEGRVVFVDDLGTVHVQWDTGSKLGLIPGEDQWEPVGCDFGGCPATARLKIGQYVEGRLVEVRQACTEHAELLAQINNTEVVEGE